MKVSFKQKDRLINRKNNFKNAQSIVSKMNTRDKLEISAEEASRYLGLSIEEIFKRNIPLDLTSVAYYKFKLCRRA